MWFADVWLCLCFVCHELCFDIVFVFLFVALLFFFVSCLFTCCYLLVSPLFFDVIVLL